MQATPARSSRITKSRKPSVAAALGLRRSTSSPSSASPRRKSSGTPKPPSRTPSQTHDDFDEKLDDTGVIISLASDLNFRDVPQYMAYIRTHMFNDIPSAAGMNSTRIAEVLNYQKNLPPIVSIAHLDALSPSSTKTEREIAELAAKGVVRRINVPSRGVGAQDIGDGIVSVLDWESLLNHRQDIDSELKSKYLALLHHNPTTSTIPGAAFTPQELSTLTTTGFLTSTSIASTHSSFFASLGTTGPLSSLATSGSRHASGSMAAVGGAEANVHIPGGGGTGTGTATQRPSSAMYNFSLPNTGSMIKLLQEARTHLLSFLRKTKHKELPQDMLRERWNGGAARDDEQSRGKRARGEFVGVLPGRTKKWKAFYGMRFEWILEECCGAGLVECFGTGAGVGVRML